MQSAIDWQHQSSGIDFDVLSSMISELVRHHESQLMGDELNLDWESPSSLTRIVKYGTSGSLYNVINQVPDAIAAEYQLSYKGVAVFSWCEYRWPHLHDRYQSRPHQMINLPDGCFDELMRYHIDTDSSWLRRYQARLRGNAVAQIDEVSVVTETDSVQIL